MVPMRERWKARSYRVIKSLAVILSLLPQLVDGDIYLIEQNKKKNNNIYHNSVTTAEPPTHIPILKFIDHKNPDGSYTYGYKSSDGSYKLEVRKASGEVRGKFGYRDPQGVFRETEYQIPAPSIEPKYKTTVPPIERNYKATLRTIELEYKPTVRPIDSKYQPTVPSIKSVSDITLTTGKTVSYLMNKRQKEVLAQLGGHGPNVDVSQVARVSKVPVVRAQLYDPIVAVPGVYGEGTTRRSLVFGDKKDAALREGGPTDVNSGQRFRIPASSRSIQIESVIGKSSDFIEKWTRKQINKFSRKNSMSASNFAKTHLTRPRNTIRFETIPQRSITRTGSLDVRKHPEELLAQKLADFQRQQQQQQQRFDSPQLHEQHRHQQGVSLTRHKQTLFHGQQNQQSAPHVLLQQEYQLNASYEQHHQHQNLSHLQKSVSRKQQHNQKESHVEQRQQLVVSHGHKKNVSNNVEPLFNRDFKTGSYTLVYTGG